MISSLHRSTEPDQTLGAHQAAKITIFTFPCQTALFVDFLETGYMFLLHLSCIHHHFTNEFPCLHLLTGCFTNKEPCPHLSSEFSYVVIFAARCTLMGRNYGEGVHLHLKYNVKQRA